jgi:transposase
MADWSVAVFQRLRPVRQLLRGEIRQGPLVQIGETTVQVMGEPGRAGSSKSYMWVFLGGRAGQPVVEYQYHPSRSGKIPLEVLQGYRGFIQTDGYEGYRELGSQPGIVHVDCWAHVRRKFFEAREVSRNKGSADAALSSIDTLFKIERTLGDQNLTSDQFAHRRREQVQQVLEKLSA